MSPDAVNKWMSLLANVGVIAGIIFLSLEILQNQQIFEVSKGSIRLYGLQKYINTVEGFL